MKDQLYLQYAAEQFAQAMAKIVELQFEAEQYKQAIIQLQGVNTELKSRVESGESIEKKEED